MPDLPRDLIRRALQEDGAQADITTLCTVPAEQTAGASIIARQAGVIAGLHIAAATFRELDPQVSVELLVEDGAAVQAGQVVAHVSGPAHSLLSAERVALNFLGHLSGIATVTARCVQAVEGTKARILDTRKTTPGLRSLEKEAVRLGGGRNHRFNLSDGVLIKDNHIKAAGGIGSGSGCNPAGQHARRDHAQRGRVSAPCCTKGADRGIRQHWHQRYKISCSCSHRRRFHFARSDNAFGSQF